MLYKSSNLKFYCQQLLKRDGNYIHIQPTAQIVFGDCLAISTIKLRKFQKKFRLFHPSGSLGAKLKTVGDLMYKGKNSIYQSNSNVKNAEIFNKKNLGILIAKDNRGNATGVLSDGDFKRISSKSENIGITNQK